MSIEHLASSIQHLSEFRFDMTHHDEFNDELLSAYVDGELTADDRALVEDRLRTDPQAAQLVEELRSLSSAVKSLPRETLGRDLRASIWSEIDHAQVDHDDARRVIPLSEPLDPPRGFRRGFFWSTIAIAAALMIMFLQEGEQDGDRDVAAVAKKEAEQTAAGRDNGRLALEDGELPNLGEMRSLKATTDEAMPAAPAPAEPASAEPGAMAETAPADGGELERLGNQPATEQQLAQFGAQPAQTEALAELEAGQSDALGAAAAPAAMPIDQPAPLATVELAVKVNDGLARFKRHLAENNFATSTPPEEAAAGLGGGFGGESESAAASSEVDRHYARGGGQKSEAELAPVEVLVEGSPQQIKSLVAACQTDRDYFAEVNAPDYLTHNGLFSYEAAPTDGAVAGSAASTLDAAGEIQSRQRDLAVRPQSRAAGPQEGQEEAEQRTEARGRAWILSYGLFAGGGRQEADKAKDAYSESAVELGAPLEDKADLARRSTSLGFRQQTDSLAKQLSQPPEEGRVRVRFVLRDAEPQATAAPAAAKP